MIPAERNTHKLAIASVFRNGAALRVCVLYMLCELVALSSCVLNNFSTDEVKPFTSGTYATHTFVLSHGFDFILCYFMRCQAARLRIQTTYVVLFVDGVAVSRPRIHVATHGDHTRRRKSVCTHISAGSRAEINIIRFSCHVSDGHDEFIIICLFSVFVFLNDFLSIWNVDEFHSVLCVECSMTFKCEQLPLLFVAQWIIFAV